jgi:hypothetical protein
MKRKLLMVARLFALAGVLGVSSAHRVAAQDVPIPFVVTEQVNVNNFTITPIAIPQGMRLVIDYISMSGAAQSNSGPIQPVVILNAQVGDGASNAFYFEPPPSATVSGQYYLSEKTVIYADSLNISPAFSGYTPSFLVFNVVISGHLIPLPSDPPPVVGPLINRSVPMPGIVAPVSGTSRAPIRR